MNKQFTFYWLDGKKEILTGMSPLGCLNRAGYGAGAMRALDFCVEGDNNNYVWKDGKWVMCTHNVMWLIGTRNNSYWQCSNCDYTSSSCSLVKNEVH